MKANKSLRPSAATILALIVLMVYAGVVFFLLYRHEQWIDELNAWRISKNYSIPEIWDLMHTEGHFILWYLLLYPFSHLGFDTVWMGVVSCVLMIISAHYILFKSNFSFESKILIVFSYASVFCFPVVSRCYALIPPLIFALAYLYPQRHEKGTLYGLILGLIANTHLFMEGFYFILLLLFAHETFFDLRKSGSPAKYKSCLYGVIFAFIGGLLGFLQVIGAFFDESSKNLIGGLAERPVAVIHDVLDVYFCLPIRSNMTFFIIYFVVFVVALFLFIKIFSRERKLACILLFTLIYQLFFSLFIYGMNFQRLMLPFYIILFCIWNVHQTIYSRVLIASMCICSSCHGYKYVVDDIKHEFSCERKVYDYIAQEKPQTLYAVGSSSIAMECFSPLIDYVHVGNVQELGKIEKPDSFTVLYLVWHFETKVKVESLMENDGYEMKSYKEFSPGLNPPTAKGTYGIYEFEKKQ